MHLDGGVGPSGERVLGADSVALMQQPRISMPASGSVVASVGLSWRIKDWDAHPVIGHDGSTVGQSSHLLLDPAVGLAACLLTNATDSEGLYERLLAEVLHAHAGIAPPAGPGPAPSADDPAGTDLSRHVGRYERTTRRYDVSVRDGLLHLTAAVTGQLAATRGDEQPEELDLLPPTIPATASCAGRTRTSRGRWSASPG